MITVFQAEHELVVQRIGKLAFADRLQKVLDGNAVNAFLIVVQPAVITRYLVL
jgi:hypothetical protein